MDFKIFPKILELRDVSMNVANAADCSWSRHFLILASVVGKECNETVVDR